jgi:hypothetical protein
LLAPRLPAKVKRSAVNGKHTATRPNILRLRVAAGQGCPVGRIPARVTA